MTLQTNVLGILKLLFFGGMVESSFKGRLPRFLSDQ